MARVKLSETCVSVQCSELISGLTKTLQPYTAPRQSCMMTAATAIPQRFARRSVAIVVLHFLKYDSRSTGSYQVVPIAIALANCRLLTHPPRSVPRSIPIRQSVGEQ